MPAPKLTGTAQGSLTRTGREVPVQCEVCGGSLRSDNRTGVCNRTQECKRVGYRLRLARNPALRERKKESTRHWYAAMRQENPLPSCEMCGGPIQSNNKYGVCLRTPECRKEQGRRRYAGNPERACERVRRRNQTV